MSRFFHATMMLVVLTVLVITIYGMHMTDLRVRIAQIVPKIGLYCLVLTAAAFYKYRGVDNFVSALLIVFWMGLVSDLHVYPMFIAGRQPAPFYDEHLAMIDRVLGLEVTDVLAWIDSFPVARELLHRIYYTLVFLMATALLSTTLLGRLKEAQEYVISMVCAVAITFPLFAIFQAQGPFVYYGFPANPAQSEFLSVLAALKAEGLFTMDLGYASGLITFPSFHTILALLAGIALWSFPVVRWLGLIWAGLIVLSTLTTGWHYTIDVLAGILVTVLSVLGAKAFSWLEVRLSRRFALAPPEPSQGSPRQSLETHIAAAQHHAHALQPLETPESVAQDRGDGDRGARLDQ